MRGTAKPGTSVHWLFHYTLHRERHIPMSKTHSICIVYTDIVTLAVGYVVQGIFIAELASKRMLTIRKAIFVQRQRGWRGW